MVKTKKIVKIVVERCGQCPNLGERRWSKLTRFCKLTHGEIKSLVKVPDWCPLDNAPEPIEEGQRKLDL